MKSSYHTRRLGLLSSVMLLAWLGLGLLPATVGAADGFANDAFARAYAAGGLGQALWGTPGKVLNETYLAIKGGQRQVQYFDKGRMELTYPENQPGFVGDGKLVVEMVSGRMQVSDTVFWQYDGAEMPVTGGTTFASNPGAPSYRAMQSLTGSNASRVGKPVTAVLASPEDEGFLLGIYFLTTDNALGTLAKNAAYIPETAHNIPDVFWSYLNQKNADGLPAFNWESLFGLPITDSYWAKVRDGSQVYDILVQMFERRTLLYNPAAPVGQQVQSGNVGRDYYRWRYEQPELPVIDDTTHPPDTSANAKVSPAVGEAGTTFVREAWGFQPYEAIDAYARVSPDGGIYPLSYQADGNGKLIRSTTTQPLQSPTEEIYYVLKGQSSGVTAIWHLKIIGSIRYTPAVEAVQPAEVPPGQKAEIDRKVLRVGETSRVYAVGFKPNEIVNAWVTTPLHRVVGNTPYVRLQADKDGVIKPILDAPGVPEPGVFSLTLYGTQSQNTAIAYFRVKTGPATLYDPFWRLFVSGGSRSSFVESTPLDLRSLTQHRNEYRLAAQQAIATEGK